MSQSIDYHVERSMNSWKLTEQVNQLLQEGWLLQGGVSMSVIDRNGSTTEYFAQALIKNRSE